MGNFLKLLVPIGYLWTNLSAASPMSEKDAILKALELNRSISISKIDLIGDSLSYEKQCLIRLPQVTFSLSPSITPNDATSKTIGTLANNNQLLFSTIDTSFQSTKTNGSVYVTQDLPMGASLTTAFDQSITSKIPSDTVSWGSIVTLSASQQLLRGAFKHDSVSYSLKMARFENESVSLSYKKVLIAELTKIRTLYWNYYLYHTMESIAQQQLTYAKKQHEVALDRFSIGDVAEIDTLSAALEELRLQQSLISATYTTMEIRTDLATELQMSIDSVTIPETLEIVIEELPEPQELISRARKFDPDIQLFSLLREKFMLQLQQTRNGMLPSLAAKASYTLNRNGDSFFSSNQSKRNNLVLELLFSYDLPSRSHSIEVSKAKLQVKSNEINSQQQQTKLTNNMEKLRQTWKKEKAKIELAKAAVTVSQRLLIAAQQGYELGSVDRLELLKAQNDASSAQTEYIQGLVEMKLLEISIEEITGTVLNRFGVQL